MSPEDPARREAQLFEDDVRRIARQLWPDAEFSGATNVDDRERDGVFETEESIHLIEATTSRKKEKVVHDVAKLTSLAKQQHRRSGMKSVRCWLITRNEPTADQRAVAEKHRDVVVILSFAQFQSRPR